MGDVKEISFFKLAERVDMARGQRRRWRDSRDTLPARRRRRRSHRRDRRSSRDYHPMKVDREAAYRGVRSRLWGAAASALVAMLCLMSLVLAPELTLGSTLPLAIGIGSLGLSTALAMSARREEIVHQVAGQLTRDGEPKALPDQESKALVSGEDGHMGGLGQRWVDDADREAGQRRSLHIR